MHFIELKLGQNSHEYVRNADENRICAAQKESADDNREASSIGKKKDFEDIADAADSLLYSQGIDY